MKLFDGFTRGEMLLWGWLELARQNDIRLPAFLRDFLGEDPSVASPSFRLRDFSLSLR